MKIYKTNSPGGFAAGEYTRETLEEKETHKILFVKIDAGVEIPSCVMKSHTIFHILDGTGTVTANGETRRVTAGDLVSIAGGAGRALKAVSPLAVLAVQIHPQPNAPVQRRPA